MLTRCDKARGVNSPNWNAPTFAKTQVIGISRLEAWFAG